MKGWRRPTWLGVLVVGLGTGGLGVACGDPEPPAPATAELEEGIVARVGDVAISQETVARIAAAQQLTPREALDVAIGDAVFEAEARRRGWLDTQSPEFDRHLARRARGELARAVLIQVGKEAAGPVTDQELAELSEKHWMEVKRPQAWRVAHALVLKPEPSHEEPEPDLRQAMLKSAEEIVEAMEPVVEKTRTTPVPERRGARVEDMRTVDLRKAVAALPKVRFPADGPELATKVEELPPLVEEGWALVPSRKRFDPDFVKAAAALKERGDVSPFVWSPYGVHVIMLLEVVAGNVVPDDELRELFLTEATALRAKAAHNELLEELRGKAEISEAHGVDALLRSVGEGS